MLVLAIDSSSSTATCALVSEKGVLGEINLNDKKQHSVLLMDLIDDLLKYNNLKIKDLDGFAISEGPGSFTGLRIGMATVKGLSFGSKKPSVCVSSLDALAYNISGFNGIICPIIDALRRNVYASLYKKEGDELISLSEKECISLTDLIEKIKEKNDDVIFVGDGISKHKEALIEALPNCSFAPSHSSYPRAASVGELGLRLLESGVSHDLNTYAPIYLRKSQAEREYEERMRLK